MVSRHYTLHMLRRPPRLTYNYTDRSRPLFFITFCTKDRRRMLACPEIHESFLAFARSSPEIAQVWVGRYVIMPDHLHTFVSAEGSQALQRWVASLKRNLTRKLKELGHRSPHWQQGFFDHILRSDESMAVCGTEPRTSGFLLATRGLALCRGN